MHTKTKEQTEKPLTFSIRTFGCQMNEHDSEKMAGMLAAMGAKACDEGCEQAADVLIINTCSVRDNADKRFFGVLGQVKKAKIERPEMIVGVCGCMMQQQHIVDELKQKYPWVDLVFGTHNLHTLPQLIEEARRRRLLTASGVDKAVYQDKGQEKNRARHKAESLVSVWDDMPEIIEGVPVKRMHGYKAFVNIMYGCNNFCTYCIVPYTRGREKSRRPEEIIKEVESLVAAGTKEIVLLGQNVNSYGRNSGFDMDFAGLINRLDAVKGLERLRFMTSHPKDISGRLIEAFARCQSLRRCIHLPVQSGSNAVLARMNRGYTKEEYLECIQKLREASPGLAVSTDIIVGFPGESEEDFEQTMDLVRRAEFASAFTFLYSVRTGTPAASYKDQIPDAVKHERFDRLVKLLNDIMARQNKAYEGCVLPVLVEGESKTGRQSYTGRTLENKIVNFPLPEGVSGPSLIGCTVPVLIVKAQTFSLTGQIAAEKDTAVQEMLCGKI